MNRFLILGTLFISLLSIALSAVAQQPPPANQPSVEIKAIRINGQTPVVDGNPNEALWESCNGTCAKNFTQRTPNDGKPATESTTVAVMYDDNALYIAFWCYDAQPDKIIRELVRRDRYSESDYVEAAIDPFHDHQTGNEFVVCASGSLQDSRLSDDESSDMSWDGVWEGATQPQPWGYSVEMKIPYHCLRFTPSEIQTWGINFFRYVGRIKEESRWSYTPQSTAGFTSRMGHLSGIQNIKPMRHFEIMPYGVSSMESQPKSPQNKDGKTFSGNTGVDMKYGISSNLVLDATINPDFGQVELDQPVLNLSTYETYYEEKRPFFQEGANLFTTDFTLFYSRRVGRAPQYNVEDPEARFYTDYPKATTILGAGRLTGKIAKRTTIAVLSAMTAEEKAKYAVFTDSIPNTNPDGDTTSWVYTDTTYRKGVVEPLGNYSIFRIKQDILKNSYFGGMLTVASQDHVHPAVTGGFDWNLSTNSRSWLLGGQTVFSRVDPENNGFGFVAYLQKNSGKHIRGSISTRFSSPELEISRLGYLGRNDTKNFSGWIQYRTTNPWWIFKKTYNNFNIFSKWNYDGVNYQRGGNVNSSFEFTNNWTLNAAVNVQGEKYSDEETRGNGLWIWPEYPTYSIDACGSTDTRKNIWIHFGGTYGTDRGGDYFGNHGSITFKPQSNLEFVFNENFNQYSNSIRWVTNAYGQPMFADLNYKNFSFGLTANILFNRNLSLQISGEGTINGLDYSKYRYYLGDNTYSDTVSYIDRDRNYSALNTMMLLRWEYLPGSTLYLVWTRGIDKTDRSLNNLDIFRDMKGLFGSGSDNVFLLKLSYWMNI